MNRTGGADVTPATDPSELDLRSAFDNAPIGIVVMTPVGVVTACNTALGELLERPPHSLVGRTLFDVTHPEDLPDARRSCALIQSGAVRILRHECRFLRADGAAVWVMVSTSRVPAAPDRPAHLIMHIEDVDDRKALEAELTHQALHDPLTGLPNRALLTRQLNDALAGSGRHSRPSCLLYMDLDGFKAVNDLHGHAAGDEFLRELARRITAVLRPDDICARLGGDEFVVLCADTDPEQADAIAERLRAAAAEPFTVDGRTIRLTAAVGISTSPVARSQPVAAADLLRQADQRMYEAKSRPREGGGPPPRPGPDA